MTSKEAKEILKNTRYFSQEEMPNGMYERFAKLREALVSREENSPYLLNKGNVTGVWYMTDLAYAEGNPQIILRVDESKPEMKNGTYERFLLDGELFSFIHNDVNFGYNDEITKGDSLFKGTQEMLFAEIEQGRVLTIYDKERD